MLDTHEFLSLQNTRRVGSIPGSLPLNAYDVGCGEAQDGQIIFFAWGANWSDVQAEQRSAAIKLPVVYTGDVWEGSERRANYAPVISSEAMAKLGPILVGTSGTRFDQEG